jgi:hypothetical protein
MVVVTISTLVRPRQLPGLPSPVRKLVSLPLVGCVTFPVILLEHLLIGFAFQTGLLRGSVKVKEA